MQTYTETILRYVVEYLEQYPAEHQAEMRLNGIDPDDYWQLKWSFEREQDAIAQMEADRAWYVDFCKEHGYTPKKIFRVRDLGETQYIERQVSF